MFGENSTEYSAKQGKEVPVWQSPKYLQSKEKALESMKTYPFLKEGDFWILMNETKNGKMAYSGLIISHNACLKINDNLPAEDRFKPECVAENQNGYRESLVYTYCCPEQGLFEVGEVSAKNCKNDYPYAMAFKRLFDRVVLKQCKLSYDGIYSDSEADEFKEHPDDTPETQMITALQKETILSLCNETNTQLAKILKYYEKGKLEELTEAESANAIEILESKVKK